MSRCLTKRSAADSESDPGQWNVNRIAGFSALQEQFVLFVQPASLQCHGVSNWKATSTHNIERRKAETARVSIRLKTRPFPRSRLPSLMPGSA